MDQIIAIVKKDILQWTRRPLYFISSILLAVLIIWIVGNTLSGADNIPLGIYDPSGISQLSKVFSQSNKFKVKEYNNLDTAKHDVATKKIAVLANVSQDPLEDRVEIITEGRDPMIDQQISMGILNTLTKQATSLNLPLTTSELYPANFTLRDFMTPGLAAYLCYVLASMNLGFSWIYEWMERTYRQIILAPHGLRAAIIAKTSTVTVEASLVLWIALLITAPIAHFSLGNNPLMSATFTLLSVFCFACIGLAFACLLKTIRIYTMTVSILGVALMFASGIVLPVETMPDWERWTATALPMYYSADAFKGAFLGIPANYGFDALVLLSWAAVGLIVAIILLRQQQATLA